MLNNRASGVLLPVFSLPGSQGIGVLGKEAFEFVDFLAESKQKYWQVLPIGVTSYGDSPYQSFSSYAGNPYFIDLEEMIEMGYLNKNDVYGTAWSQFVDYEELWHRKYMLLRKAFNNGFEELKDDMRNFSEKNQWLQDFSLFMALKNHFNHVSRSRWPEAQFKKYGVRPELLQAVRKDQDFYVFIQYFFFKQWHSLKKYAHNNGIKIIGDIPIFVSEDSVDIWAYPEYFQLDSSGKPTAVAGVPPDAFSDTGQLWGNPLYNWDKMQYDHFSWWVNRIKESLQLFDMLRLDHFRGFEAYWAVPYGDTTAENGQWIKAPGSCLFDTVHHELGSISAIAEDLGVITDEVRDLIKQTGFPGMKILLFAFSHTEADSFYRPHHFPKNCVVYTGTHDNETVAGWFKNGDPRDVACAAGYFNLKNPTSESFARAFVKGAWESNANLAIAPMQDILGLDNHARINHPSTLHNNWRWRLEYLPDQNTVKFLTELTISSGRLQGENEK